MCHSPLVENPAPGLLPATSTRLICCGNPFRTRKVHWASGGLPPDPLHPAQPQREAEPPVPALRRSIITATVLKCNPSVTTHILTRSGETTVHFLLQPSDTTSCWQSSRRSCTFTVFSRAKSVRTRLKSAEEMKLGVLIANIAKFSVRCFNAVRC